MTKEIRLNTGTEFDARGDGTVEGDDVMAVVQIVEMDQERDRKTCLSLAVKETGASRELAQWLLDHPKYSAPMVAGWIGCGDTRIRQLRRWAAGGFIGAPSNDEKRKQRDEDQRHGADESLETNDNSDSDADDFLGTPKKRKDYFILQANVIIERAEFGDVPDRDICNAARRVVTTWTNFLADLEKRG